ncbi:hypothetical protein BsWGS_16828 [Bradybaena similaris]
MADIDVEDENILSSIFKDSFPDSWQDNPDFVQYLVELSSYGADRLAREPDRLAEEKAQILAETQDLAFHNYTTFIQTADCSREIFQDFQIIEQHLENLLNKLPHFSNECGKVIQKAQEISSSRRMNTLTLQRHTQLLEVLEMPQLMDTCVRNGYYEEALELAAHVKRLEKKHPNIPVIAGIVQEVKVSTQLMLNQLIQQLRSNLQLPACLRVIGFLRRMDVFTEAELRIKFLQARDSWFQSILDAIPKGDAYTHITKTIEVSRVHLFDIMTQFRAIFSDEDPLISTGKEEAVNESLLFQSWVLQKISQFLLTLENDLEEGIGGRLDSILGQCMYFGLSFSRVGADFRGLLAPVFERAVLRYFSSALRDANKKFEDNMQSFNLLGLTTSGTLSLGLASSQLYPPTSLLDFYPLVAYCNHVLAAFNDLRLCSPLNLTCKIVDELRRSLLDVNRVILAFHRAEETTFNAKEKDQFEQFCATYATDLLPYLNRCLQSLFPPAQLANALGISVTELGKKGNVGQVDLTVVLGGVAHLMPAPAPAAPEPRDEADKPVTFTLGADGEDGHVEEPAVRIDASSVESAAGSLAVLSGAPADLHGIPTFSNPESGESVAYTEVSNEKVEVDVSLVSDPAVLPPFASDEVEASGQGDATAKASQSNPELTETTLDQKNKEVTPSVSDTAHHPREQLLTAVNPDKVDPSVASGGWDTAEFDLDNLDDVNIEDSSAVVDLDLLPTPEEGALQ